MTTGTYECLPTAIVLLSGGSMLFDDLANKLMSADPSRFRGISKVEEAVNRYSNCLENNGHRITYNKNSKSYSKFNSAINERHVQRWLHQTVPDMEKWQLYPFKTPSNSESCYLNIPWKEIPKDTSEIHLQEKYRSGVNYKCDFRCEGENSCTASCGISEETKRKYFQVFIGMLDENEWIDRLGKEEFDKKFKNSSRRYERKPDDAIL